MRAQKRREHAYWQPLAFVGSTKRVLRRVLREKGIHPTPEAAEYLDAMPDTFKIWHECYTAAQTISEAAE